MQIVLGGVRGSACMPHTAFQHYGGATTSVLADDGRGTRVVFDAGSGLQTLAPQISDTNAEHTLLMLFTHYHLDHLIGLPSFAPLYNPAWHVIFAAPIRAGNTPENALRQLITAPYWPSQIPQHHRFITLPDHCGSSTYEHGSFTLRWCAVHHHSGCHAYRLDHRATGASMVFATDFEWSASNASERDGLLRLCREPGTVDVLIAEGNDPSTHRAGHGHSTWPEAVEIAEAVGAHQLIITHHGPADTDNILTQREQNLKKRLPSAKLGYQGMRIDWRHQNELQTK